MATVFSFLFIFKKGEGKNDPHKGDGHSFFNMEIQSTGQTGYIHVHAPTKFIFRKQGYKLGLISPADFDDHYKSNDNIIKTPFLLFFFSHRNTQANN